VRFYSAVCVRAQQRVDAFVDTTVCDFRTLSLAEITRYVAAEPALDCAGSFKSEGLGASLLRNLRAEDPTGLIGLPLIALAQSLRNFGFALP
jgi:septum formation protein